MRAKGPVHTSLEQRPRNRSTRFSPSTNGAIHRLGKIFVDWWVACDGNMERASSLRPRALSEKSQRGFSKAFTMNAFEASQVSSCLLLPLKMAVFWFILNGLAGLVWVLGIVRKFRRFSFQPALDYLIGLAAAGCAFRSHASHPFMALPTSVDGGSDQHQRAGIRRLPSSPISVD